MTTYFTNNPSRFGGCFATHNPTISQASGVTPPVTPAPDVGGKHKPYRPRKRWYEVEIDGEVFEVRGEQEALDLLMQARKTAKEAATKAAQAAVAAAPLDVVPEPRVPTIKAPAELVERIGLEWAQTVDELDAFYRIAFYKAAQREQQLRIDDEEAAILLLLH